MTNGCCKLQTEYKQDYSYQGDALNVPTAS